MPTRLINVSNRLPVTLGDDLSVKKSSGGLVAALEGLSKEEFELTWLGWPGKDVPEDQRARVARAMEAEHGCSPIFIEQEVADAHYEGLSNSSIWPLLHYMPSNFRYKAQWWDAYVEVNRRFAEKVLSVAKDGDLVWVHDYQLMPLPKMLKEARPSLRVGFFLHTPFPSYEVFRCHPRREQLVEGLLGADLVGFHTFGYLRHFRSSALRLLGLESEITTIRHDGRATSLGVFPIGINGPKFDQELDSPAFATEFAEFAKTHEGSRVVLSVERLDYSKGILHRLDAIELFLEQLPKDRRDSVKFVFISVPSRENVDEYKALREELEYRVGRINGQFATLHSSPVRFIHGSVNFTELCALYALADVGLVTPLIDGMNLVAKEYVACQREQRPVGNKGSGVLVLSEFAGAAEELFDALLVNPYDAPAVAATVGKALDMPDQERRRRMAAMRRRVMTYDAAAWAKDFIADLMPAGQSPRGGAADAADAAARGSDPADAQKRLEAGVVTGKRVALFLDYDGTLRELVRDPAAAGPTPELRQVLDRLALCCGEQIDVTIISGRTPQDLESFLGAYGVFGLIAEHGASIRHPRTRQWEHLDANISYAWKDEVRKILRLYEESTPGTHIEDKRTSLVWHYRRAHPEFGEWKARQLVEDLSIVSANEPIHLLHGRKIVEVTAQQINKGAAVATLLRETRYDLVLIAGDDTTDESMFRLDSSLCPDLITIHVGERDTRAQYRLESPAALRRLLMVCFAPHA